MTSTSKDPAVSELDVYGAILDGVGELATKTTICLSCGRSWTRR